MRFAKRKTYVTPSISEEIVLAVDSPCLAGANSVNSKKMSIEHEDSGIVDSGWSTNWERDNS